MCDKRKLKGFYTGYKDATDQPARLTDEPFNCDFVMLSVSNTEDDKSDTPKPTDGNNLYDEAREEIYWGFDNVCAHQIFPKETTDFIPVESGRDIFVRSSQAKAGISRVSFSCFKYVED